MKKKYLLLIGILIIATFFRFYHFTDTPPGLYPDEAIDGNNAAEAATTGRYQVFYTEDNGREGLYVNLVAGLLQYFNAPHEPWVIRLPAAIAGVLTVLGLYLLATELFGTATGLLSAFLLATSFWHINFSRIGFRAILAPLLLAWSIYFLVKAMKAASAELGIFLAIIAGAVYSLGFYTYIAYRATPLIFLLFIPFFRRHPGFWKKVAVFVVTIFIVAAPIGWYFVKHPADFLGRTSQISVTNSANPIGHLAMNFFKTVGMLIFHGDDNWRHNLSGWPELFIPVALLFFLGIILGIYWLRKQWHARDERTFGLWLLFAWFIFATLPAAASDEGIPHALRSILMLPPVILFAALAGIWLYRSIEKHWGKKASWNIAAIFLFATFAFAYVQYFVLWAMHPNVTGEFNAKYVAIGREINALQQSTPKYVVVEAGGVMTRGIPMPAETTIFITDSFLPSEQAAKNIHYVLPSEIKSIPRGAAVFYIK
jgi:4-amino-4-deoxy-L-arabinose transferase-like glycosyltransferase